MEVHRDDIGAFKALFEQEFQECIAWSEAERMAAEVLALYEAIWQTALDAAVTRPRDTQARTDRSAI